MGPDLENQQTKIKVYICREDCTPILVHQLTAIGQDEFRALLRHLELFAEFLPYLARAEKEIADSACQQSFQLRITLDNLQAAIELATSQHNGVTKLVPIMKEHNATHHQS